MSKLDRRTFIKLMGQGTAVLGLGLSGCTYARSAGVKATKQAGQPVDAWDWNAWEFYYPGKYNDADAKVINEFYAECEKINKRGDIDINDLVSGKLTDAPGVEKRAMKVTLEDMMSRANACVPNIPLFNDKEYAKNTEYGDLVAFPLILALEVFPKMPDSDGIGDYMLVTEHHDTVSYYKPVYEGDTLYTVLDEQHPADITPATGSYYRTFVMSGSARVFNQKGELVAEGANIVKESYRRRKDPSKRNPDKMAGWESPNWWQRKAHQYTDKDWDKIISMWKNEKSRGSTPLYWDDVKIGEDLAPAAYGPYMPEKEIDMIFFGNIPEWSRDIKKNVLDPKTFAGMVKNKQGIYVLPEHPEVLYNPNPGKAGPPGVTPELVKRDGRAVFQNATLPHFAAGMIYDWMGEEGWLQRIGWNLMAPPVPGYPESVIPSITKEMMPALFDKFPYMEKVPYMKGKRANCHAMQGDLIICRAYVFNKYNKGNEYFIDLTWWCETIENDIIEEGFATVKLPKKA